MKYISVCSGIEAATVAWHPLGWEAFAYSEIEKFPCSVLQHHYPQTPNFGDMTKFKEWPHANVDVLVGGTPCQSFSIAGLRKGLDDPRGNLMLTYLAIADKYRPKWILWENVPGVLSSNRGRDFGNLLGGLAKLGYGFAYRVLDAQYVRTDGHPYAVPQRRRRVFVVGHIGSWQRAAAVLFDRESLSGNPAPRRCAGQEVAKCLTTGIGKRYDAETDTFAIAGNIVGRQPLNGGNGNGYDDGGASYTLTKTDVHAVAFGVSEKPDVAHCLRSGASKADKHESTTYIAQPNQQVAFYENHPADSRVTEMGEVCTTVTSRWGTGGGNVPYAQMLMQVRRLTPTECARLQGFPDNYLSQVKGASDSAMYKALGNSMAVNVMQLLGERIAMVEAVENIKAVA